MHHDTTQLHLERRILGLERSLTRTRALALGALALALALWTTSSRQAVRTEEVLRAKRIEVVGSSGRLAFVATTDDAQNGVLTLVSEGGAAALALSVDRDAGSLEIWNGEGNGIVALGTDGLANGVLQLGNSAGNRTVTAGSGADGGGGVLTNNDAGAQRFYMGQDLRGNGVVGSSEKPGWRVN